MSKKKDDNFIDDNRTIVDMSGVERPSLFGHNFKEVRASREEDESFDENERPWEKHKDDLNRKERWYAIKGALGATLLIWLCYAIVFALFILLILFIYKRNM